MLRPPLASTVLVHRPTPLAFSLYAQTPRGEHHLWTNLNKDRTWAPLLFQLAIDNASLASNPPSQHCFELTVQTRDLDSGWYQFSVRSRREQDDKDEWRWWTAGEGENGLVCVTERDETEDLRPYHVLDGIPNTIRVVNEQGWLAPSSDVRCFHFQVPLLTDHRNTRATTPLGRPTNLVHYLGLERKSWWWLNPTTASLNHTSPAHISLPHLPRDLHFLLHRHSPGHLSLLIPITTPDVSTALQTDTTGTLHLLARNETQLPRQHASLALLLVRDTTPRMIFDLVSVAKLFIVSRILNHHSYPSLFLPSPTPHPTLDYLGYCTWNSLGPDLTHTTLLTALSILRAHDIPIAHILLDDGWADVDPLNRLRGFDTDPRKFPLGLKATIEQVLHENPGIRTVGVWHTLWGWWHGVNGVKPKGAEEEGKDGGEPETTDTPTGVRLLRRHADVARFYDTFYTHLKECGVGMVKVDNQAGFDEVEAEVGEAGEGPLWRTYQGVMWEAARRQLGDRGAVVYCMAQSPRYIFDVFWREEEGTRILRTSDDFFPTAPPSAHPWHLHSNALTSLFLLPPTTSTTLVPDWDMFQTIHPYGAYHASARALSGGPIYITDTPGSHSASITLRLGAHSKRDGWRVLRCERAAMPCVETVWGGDPGRSHGAGVVKLWNENVWDGGHACGVVGVWNAREEGSVVGVVSALDVPTANPGPRVVAWLHNRRVTISVPASDSCIPVLLPPRGFEIVHFVPLDIVSLPIPGGSLVEGSELRLACLGLVDKYNCTRAVLRAGVEEAGGGTVRYMARLWAADCGGCGFFVEAWGGIEVRGIVAMVDGKEAGVRVEREERVVVVDMGVKEVNGDEWYEVVLTIEV
ncbi:raffinose synthase or seed imbibition protein Sip1-domain-containing protein [Jimgerdemannia flammicorona]|uniref:Raffinose synthase or seed imbibition protein Sip1-domain-containing protein n=1 Tax=Jimgerdemannia flammicorona TaxID=994334 RepID=A0A433QJ46_9FUNG|nr:raffinose synthase or seed imbibition protein Sip1-domain-containing protein [Jimgerdemannia flammicorona]